MKHPGGNLEINQKGHRVHNRSDKGAGHDSRIKAHFFRKHGKHAAHQLGHKDRENHRQAYDHSHLDGDPVEKQQLGKIQDGQSHAAENRHLELLPHHPEDISKFQLTQGNAADHRSGRLASGVSTRVHKHGNVRG